MERPSADQVRLFQKEFNDELLEQCTQASCTLTINEIQSFYESFRKLVQKCICEELLRELEALKQEMDTFDMTAISVQLLELPAKVENLKGAEVIN